MIWENKTLQGAIFYVRANRGGLMNTYK